jgi:hypothetical protein
MYYHPTATISITKPINAQLIINTDGIIVNRGWRRWIEIGG